MAYRASTRRRVIGGSIVALVILILVPAVVVAATNFEDVPPSNVFYNDIVWMAESGVTKGCSDTRFCPDDFVTREQMAAFMRRLATGGSVDAGSLGGLSASDYVTHSEIGPTTLDAETLDGLDSTAFLRKSATAADSEKLDGLDSTAFLRKGATAVDSDKLDGLDSSFFLPATGGTRAWGAQLNNVVDSNGSVLAAQIVSPAKGMLIMGANVDITATTATDKLICELAINGGLVTGSQVWVSVTNAPGVDEAICSTSGIAVVSSGTFDISLDISGLDTAGLWGGTLWAQWVPFDGDGLVPTSLAETAGAARSSVDGLPRE